MNSNERKTAAIGTFVLIGGLAGASFLIPDKVSVPSVSAQATPDVMRLTGSIRDFLSAHPDFEVMPAGGYGHYAGNLNPVLDGDGRPVFAGSGINAGGDQSDDVDLVAHWSFDDGTGKWATDTLGLNHGALMADADWVDGRYGGGVHFDGTNEYVQIPSSPEMQVTGDVTFAGWFKLDNDFDASSPETMVIMEKILDVDHDFHIALAGLDYNRPEVSKGALVFKVENGPTSDYYRYTWTNRTTWTGGAWYHFAAVLDSSDTSQNRLFINGMDDRSAVDAGGIGFVDTDYDAPMRIGGKTIDYNGFATDIYFEGSVDDVMIFKRKVNESDFVENNVGGYKVATQWQDSSSRPIAPHLYVAGTANDACSNSITDTLGSAAAPDDGGISSTATFAEWYRDILGTNLSAAHTITLLNDGTGVYEYLDDTFHPIDDRLLGNDGLLHNAHFTYAIATSFEYASCGGQFFEFQGADDAWLFIDGQLVMDLGGIVPNTSQHVSMDRLGLVDGSTYSFKFFYAQRHWASSMFRMRTNLPLDETQTVMASGGFD